ncbi:MAG: TAXI family TRAP transporter solute-binding subunit [Verrucomicrobiota bacterium]
MHSTQEKHRFKIVTALIETFGFSPWFASLVALFLLLLAAAAVVWVWLSAPPRTLTIVSGPPGSSFQRYAESYQKKLAEEGITLKIVPTGGSLDNFMKLQDPDSGTDIGFVPGGLVTGEPPPALMSLGSVAYQPLWLFYRSPTKITRLSELAGKRIGVGLPGSGTHALTSTLLQMNGITGAPSTLVEQSSETAANDLIAGKLDAVFLMGDSAPTQTLRTLIRAPDIQLFHFAQADAYVRRLEYLNKIVVPQGAIDFGLNLPAQDVVVIGPTVELVARKGLNSAISDMLLEKLKETHGNSSLLQRKAQFPAPITTGFELSADAGRYYKSGLGFTYRYVPSFWVASLVNRLLVAIVPIILIMIPLMRILPIAYRWSVQLRIYRCYRPLLRMERDTQGALTREQARALLERLDEIELDVNELKVPASFAYQFYALRGHVAFVRSRLNHAAAA